MRSGRIHLLVLDGVPSFMRSHSQRCHRVAIEVLLGKHQPAVRRVVVIGQVPLRRVQSHIPNAVKVQDPLRNVRAGVPEDPGSLE